jgi:DNA-binding helix-hairpin-helix protein with protein kinase domain
VQQFILASRGKFVRMGKEISSGREGTVYFVENYPSMAAKVYADPRLCEPDKLSYLVAHPVPEAPKPDGHRDLAWPLDMLLDPRDGEAVGFTMPYVRGDLIYRVYHPQERPPHIDDLFLLRVATHLAGVYARVHRNGYVVGDINESNVLVDDQGRVTLIDLGSIQVRTPSRTFRCKLFRPEFTPTELQTNFVFANQDREAHHDSFGLSVLLFYLLFRGRHPFLSVYRGRGAAPPLGQRIRDRGFPYASPRPPLYAPPPGPSPFDGVSQAVKGLFFRAFAPQQPQDRPTAEEWETALAQAQQEALAKPGRASSTPGSPGTWRRRIRCGVMARFAAEAGTRAARTFRRQVRAALRRWPVVAAAALAGVLVLFVLIRLQPGRARPAFAPGAPAAEESRPLQPTPRLWRQFRGDAVGPEPDQPARSP